MPQDNPSVGRRVFSRTIAKTLCLHRIFISRVVGSALIVLSLLAVMLFGAFSGFARPQAAIAQAPNTTLNFQARILNLNGSLVPDGDYHIEFKIYDTVSSGGTAQGACSGNCLWMETRTGGDVIRVVNGYVSANLGSVTSFPSNMPWGNNLYVTMRVGGAGGSPSWDAQEMTNSGNRMKMSVAPVAFVANNVASGSTNSASTNSSTISIQSGNALGTTSNSGNITIDSGTATGTTGAVTIGSTNASAVLLGRAGLTVAIQGGVSVAETAALNGDVTIGNANTDLLTISSTIQGSNALVFEGATADGFETTLAVQDPTADVTLRLPALAAGTYDICTTSGNCLGTGDIIQGGNSYTTAVTIGTNDVYDLNLETSGVTRVTIDDTTGDVNFTGNLVVAATKSLTLTGGNTASRPASPTEGMIYFDTDTDSLLTYANGKWQSDRGEYIIVASNHGTDPSTQAERDSADYVTDGTADEVEINAALTAASGGKVILLGGTYVAAATILIPNNTTLAGVGAGTNVELGNLDATENLIENTDTTTGTGITIRDLTLDGRNDLNTAGTQYGIYFNTGSSSNIENVYLNRFRNFSIYLQDNSNRNTFDNVKITSGSGDAGIGIDASDYNMVNNINVVGSAGQDNGVEIIGGEYNTVTGSTFSGTFAERAIYMHDGAILNTVSANTINGAAILHAISSETNSGANIITGNTIFGTTGIGIVLNFNSDANTVTNNNITLPGTVGIYAGFSSDNNTIDGNTITYPGGATENDGIVVDGDANQITDNYISDSTCSTACTAIEITANADNTYISGNMFVASSGTAIISNSGTGTTYASQSVAESGLNTVFRQADSTTAFAIQNNAGSSLFNADTSGGIVTITGSASVSGDFTVDTTTLVVNSTTNAVSVGGTLAVTTLGSADTSTFICRNSSNQLATCSSTPLTNSLTDNITDAFDLQEGANNYININTTNTTENISFGNATTNPSFSFLGSGALTVNGASTFNSSLTAKGQLLADGTSANQTQLIVRANASQTVANPLVLLQNSSSAELARINATTTSLYFGNAAGGNSAAGVNNTGLGASALGSVLTGTGNTTLGSGALASVSVNDNNTAVGYNAGNLATGGNNIFLGALAGDNVTTGTDNIIIGYNLDASASGATNELRIGGVLQGNTSTLAAQFNGALTAVGLLTGNLGASISGATTNINASSNFGTNINTGTSTGAVAIGNSLAGVITLQSASTIGLTGTSTITGLSAGAGTALTVNNSTSTGSIFVAQDNGTPVFTIADGGAITATQLVTLNGGLTVETGDTFTFNGDGFTDFTGGGLINSAGVLSIDTTSATGFFQNGGNTFTANATLGINANYDLNIETNSLTRLTVQADGDLAVDTNTLFVDATLNQVGIGTVSTGTSALTVAGVSALSTASALSVTNSASDNLLQVRNDGLVDIGINRSVGGTVMGNTTAGSTEDDSEWNSITAVRFTTAGATMNVTSMSVYVESVNTAPNNKYQVGIYTNGNTLVANSGEGTLVANSWNTIAITATLTASTTYKLAYMTNGSTNTNNNMMYTPSATATEYTINTYGSWPGSLGGLSAASSGDYSIYATAGNGGSALRVDQNGKVGINVQNITRAFEVLGDSSFTSAVDSSSAFAIKNSAGTSLFNLDSTNSTSTFTGTSTTANVLNVTSVNTTAGSALSITANALTTGDALNISSTGTGLTTGSLLRVSTATTGAIATDGAVSIQATGNYTSTSGIGLLSVLANTTQAGTVANIQANALTTGDALNISSTGTGLTTGSLLRVSTATTGAIATDGAVSIQATGNYTSTSNIGFVSIQANTTQAGTIQNIQGNALTSGQALYVSSSGTGLTTGSLFYGTSATTGAVATNGIFSLNATGNYTSTSNTGLLNVTANATAAGTITNIQGNGLTTGTALNVSSSGTLTTTGNIATFTANSATTATGVVAINATGLTTGSALNVTTGASAIAFNATGRAIVTGTANDAALGSVSSVVGTATSATNGQFGLYSNLTVSPVGASTQAYGALMGYATTSSANLSTGSATISGFNGISQNAGSGNLVNAFGGGVQVLNLSTGTIYNATGLYIANATNSGGGTITRSVGALVANQSVGTTNINLLLGPINAVGISGNWSIYSNSAYDSSLLGNLRIGSNVAPTVALDVTGSGLITQSSNTNTLSVVNDSLTTATGTALTTTGVLTTTGNLLTLTANSATTATGVLTVNATALTTGAGITVNTGTATAISAGGNITFQEVTGTRVLGVQTRTTNVTGTNLTVQSGQGGTTSAGGLLTLQGGSGGATSGNGGNVMLVGGTATSGTKGLVVVDTATFSAQTVQNFTANANITQASIDSFGSILISGNVAGWIATLTDPSNTTTGRVIYVTNSGSVDMTLAANTVGVALSITLKPASTATMYWNGVDWTAAGASSSTDLQAAYDNTATSAGGAEIVLSSTGTGGLTIRNDDGTAITGGLLEVQTSIGSSLFTVNNNATEYAANGGAESSTFTAWLPASGAPTETVARNTSDTGDIIATGTASASVLTTAVTGQGAENTLTAPLINGLKYQVSYAIKSSSTTGSFTELDTMYSYDGTAGNARHCVAGTAYYSTGTASQTTTTITGVGTTFTSAMVGMTFVFADGRSTVITGYTNPTTLTAGTSQSASSQNFGVWTAGYKVNSATWTRITCTFTAAPSGTTITASNSVMIRQTSGAVRTFYIDNLSVTVSADVNHAVDGSVDSALGSNWQAYDADGAAGTSTPTRDTTNIYDSSGAVADVTTAHINQGIRNNLTITPTVSTQYLVTFYTKLLSGTFTDITVGFLPAGGSSAPVTAQLCVDYNTRTLSTSSWTKITCIITTPSSGISDPDIVIYQPSATARTFYVDALSVTLNTNNSSNVQIGGGNFGGPTTLFTLDRGSNPPIAANNDAYLGSMYYDTNSGRIQCYEADGWGACGAAPDNIVNLNPEYAGAVLNGTGVGTMTSDFCGNGGGLSINTGLCDSGEAKNFYKWTSPQATQQTYSVYVTYQLPATFNGFTSDDTVQLAARVDNTTNASVTYEMFKSVSGALTQCGTGETNVITGGGGSANTWYSYGINGNEATGCSLNSSSANGFVIFKINMKANSNASAYVGTLNFVTAGR